MCRLFLPQNVGPIWKRPAAGRSFGEATSLAHAGRIGALLEEAIHRHQIIFVTSAGNSGPGLGTVGSPAAQAVGTISVGALVSPAMMATTYSMRHPSPKAPLDDVSERAL
jgi:hypothetical protein